MKNMKRRYEKQEEKRRETEKGRKRTEKLEMIN
jgi:hypothetical protein